MGGGCGAGGKEVRRTVVLGLLPGGDGDDVPGKMVGGWVGGIRKKKY